MKPTLFGTLIASTSLAAAIGKQTGNHRPLS